jgi:hypothetical protein
VRLADGFTNSKSKQRVTQSLELGTVLARVGERRGIYRVLVGKPEGKRPLGRPRRRWENNINP